MSPNTISTAANVELFGHKSSDPKHNAQQNLNGRTYYVDDDTLRFFTSRIVSAYPTENGLFFKIVESVDNFLNNQITSGLEAAASSLNDISFDISSK